MFHTLKQIRQENEVSAEKMAELLGLKTRAAYYKKESGSVKFTLEDAKKISDFFGVPVEEIFFANEVS